MENPLLSPFITVYGHTPFSKIQLKDFIPAIKKTINNALNEVEAIIKKKVTPNFKNTCEALENTGQLINRNSTILFNLNSCETSKELQEIIQEAAPLITGYQNDVILNKELFEKIKFCYENLNLDKLEPEQKTLLEKQFKTFRRNGALLSESKKNKLRLIDSELSTLSLSFGENVLQDTNSFELYVKDQNKIKNIPENILKIAKEKAESKKSKGWLFTLDFPCYVAFMKYAENRELRKKMNLAFGKRGFNKKGNNNIPVISKIINLRKNRAVILGYKSHSEFILEERMAKTEENVETFIDSLFEKFLNSAKKEWREMQSFAKNKLDIENLQKWDTAFVAEKLKKEKLNFDEEEVKPYFELEKVLNGLFQITNKLYGLKFKKNKKIDIYHKDVYVYKVVNSKSKFHALLYLDLFSRATKRDGAWMTSYRNQKNKKRPHVSIVCNFTNPSSKESSLLTFQEVTTLFHEFGHALHGILANTNYESLSGTNVYWDFVELPSQIMENWCFQKEALKIFAKNHITNKVIPNIIIEKIKNIANFQQGLQTLRQLGFAKLDLSYHGSNADKIKNIKKHEDENLSKFQFYTNEMNSCNSTSFSHIFQGGYSSGYYSYKWAEVLEADAFELFKEKGIFNKEVASSFVENILSKGGTEHPMNLYEKFRGKKPNPDALLRKFGLL